MKAFLDDGSYNISVLTRKESSSVFPDNVKVLKADYTNVSELITAMTGQDVVISMVTGFAAGGQNILVDAAIAAGVKRFFPSEFGPPSRDAKFAELNYAVLPPKAATVDYLRTKEDKISWTSLVTGAFFDWALEIGFMGLDIATRHAGCIDGGVSVFTSSTLPYIAQAVLASLKHADETKNQYVFIAEFNVSQKQLLEAVEQVHGQRWTTENLKSEDVIADGEKKLAEGDFWGVTALTRAGAMGKHALADNRTWGLWDEKLGLKRSDMKQAIGDVLSRLGEPVVQLD